MKFFCTSMKCAKPNSLAPVEKFFEGKDGRCLDCGHIMKRGESRNKIRTNASPKSIRHMHKL